MQQTGIDLTTIETLRETFGAQPEAAAFTIRTRHAWRGGLAVEGRCDGLEGAGQRLERRHTFGIDWPRSFGGGDAGPTSGESLMAALGACVSQTFAVGAAASGVEVEALEVAATGRVDLRGALGIDGVRAGFTGADVTVAVRADAEDDVLHELARTTRRTSAVFDTLAGAMPLTLTVERMAP